MTTSPSPSPTAAMLGGDTLDEVSFINPNAAQARSRRRVKLAAARARLAALAAAEAGVFSAAAATGGGGGLSEKEERKQQRMLRNRESAALSRKRKSDRIGELEIQVEALQEENRRLRQRVDRQDGNISVTPPPPAPHRAAWAPANVAAIAALSATSVAAPSAPPATTTIVPTTPPININSNNNNDLCNSDNSNPFHIAPDTIAAAAATSGRSTFTPASSSCSSSASPANACFFNISRPAVFA